jgi:putative peptidoglycan lipid II flippase
MRDTRTPAIIIVPVIIVRIVVDVLLYLVLPPAQVAAGLMIGNTISYVVNAALGYVFLRRRLGEHGRSHISATLGRVVLAALIAAVPAAVVVAIMRMMSGSGKIPSLLQLVVGSVVLGSVYLAAASWLRINEVRDLLGMVRSRLRRA